MTNRFYRTVIFALVLLIAFVLVALATHWATIESIKAIHAQEMMTQAREYEAQLEAQQTELQQQIKAQKKEFEARLDDGQAEYFYVSLYNLCYIKATQAAAKHPVFSCLGYIQKGYRLRAHSLNPKPGWDWSAIKSSTTGQIQ